MRLFKWSKNIVVSYLASIALCTAALPVMAANVSFVALHYSADRFVPQFHFDGPVVDGVNRPGFAGGSNFQIGWSHDEQNDEQVFP